MKTHICMIFFFVIATLALTEFIYFNGETPDNDYELFKYDTTTDELTQLTHMKGFISGFDHSKDG